MHSDREELATAVQRCSSSEAAVSLLERQSELDVPRAHFDASTMAEAMRARSEHLVAEARDELSSDAEIASQTRTSARLIVSQSFIFL